MSPIWVLASVFLVLAVLATAVVLLERRKAPGRFVQGEPPLPYRRRDHLLTAGERSFLGALELAFPHAGLDATRVMCKVRLADLLWLPKGLNASERATLRNKIDRKHADFVIVSADELRPLCVIELDDSSHDHPSALERDAFKDRALAAAGLPLVRIKARRGYSIEELAAALRPHAPASP